jgi:hypothetical protein
MTRQLSIPPPQPPDAHKGALHFRWPMQCDSLLVCRVVLTAPGFVVYRDVTFSFLYLCLIMFGKALVQIELVR